MLILIIAFAAQFLLAGETFKPNGIANCFACHHGNNTLQAQALYGKIYSGWCHNRIRFQLPL